VLQQRDIVGPLEAFAGLQRPIDLGSIATIAQSTANPDLEALLKLIEVDLLEDLFVIQLVEYCTTYLDKLNGIKIKEFI